MSMQCRSDCTVIHNRQNSTQMAASVFESVSGFEMPWSHFLRCDISNAYCRRLARRSRKCFARSRRGVCSPSLTRKALKGRSNQDHVCPLPSLLTPIFRTRNFCYAHSRVCRVDIKFCHKSISKPPALIFRSVFADPGTQPDEYDIFQIVRTIMCLFISILWKV